MIQRINTILGEAVDVKIYKEMTDNVLGLLKMFNSKNGYPYLYAAAYIDYLTEKNNKLNKKIERLNKKIKLLNKKDKKQ